MGDDGSDDESDIWGSIDKRAKSLFEKISDVKANQRRTDNHSNIERKSDILSDKKSRQSRKLSTESSLGNPDSGKENADIDLSSLPEFLTSSLNLTCNSHGTDFHYKFKIFRQSHLLFHWISP